MSDDYKAGADGLARPPGGNYTEFNQGKHDRAIQGQLQQQRQNDPFAPISSPPVYQSSGSVTDLKDGAWWIIAVGVGFFMVGEINGGGDGDFMGGLFALIGVIVIVTGLIGLALRNSSR